MPRSRRISLFLAGLVALVCAAAGCSGPALRIQSVNPKDQAQVYLKPVQDGSGAALPPSTPEIYIGDLPTDWEVPENLLDGRATLRLVYSDGAQQDAFITIMKRKDTVIKIAKPPIPK